MTETTSDIPGTSIWKKALEKVKYDKKYWTQLKQDINSEVKTEESKEEQKEND